MAIIGSKVRRRVGATEASKRRSIAWGKIWPHGEYSLAYVKEPVEETTFEHEYAALPTACVIPGKLGEAPLLDSSAEFSQAPKVTQSALGKKNGLKGITSYGRRMVQSGVTLLARKYGQKRLTFATLTVPALTHSERVALAEGWGEVMRQLNQWVCRRLVRSGLEAALVSVSEIQPKRLRKAGEGYLHVHAVWPNRLRHPSDYSVDVGELRAFWQGLIARIVGRSSLPNMQIRLEIVESNVAGYLAKYMSKGGEGLQQYRDDVGDEGVPGQWWNMSKPARDLTKSAILVGANTGQVLQMWLHYFQDSPDQEFPGRVRACQKEFDGRVVTLAYYGYLKPEALQDLTGMLKSGLDQIQIA